MKKYKLHTEITALIVSVLLLTASLCFTAYYKNINEKEYTEVLSESVNSIRISVRAFDGYTKQRLNNAYIVMPELGIKSLTDENGEAELLISSSLLTDEKSIKTSELFVYCEGYLPYALFNMDYSFERTVEVYMLNEAETDLDTSVIIYESPNRKYAEAYIRENQPLNIP